MATPEPSHPRVLVADDVAGTRDLIAQMLRSQGIAVLAEAADGRRCIELALERDIDVVVMDLRMPLLDGISATRVLKKCRPQVQVVMFTMFDDDADRAAAMDAGAFAFLLKGAAYIDLARVIRQAHDSSRESAA